MAANEEIPESREKFVERAIQDYQSQLIGYAYGIVHDVERARDVVQDTFIRLCQQEMGKVQAGLKTWLYTVCRNRALDVLRKERRVVEMDELKWQRLEDPNASPDSAADQGERLEQMMTLMDQLSDNQREVILLKFRDGLSYKEISDRTGLGSGNVGFILHHGLKRLREMLPADLVD